MNKLKLSTMAQAYVNEYIRKSEIPDAVRGNASISLKEAEIIERESKGKESILLAYDLGMAKAWEAAHKFAPAHDDTSEQGMNEADVELMSCIISGINNADGWNAVQLNDPVINTAENAFSAAVEILRETAPDESIDEILKRHADVVSSYCMTAMLYGLHVADVLRSATSDIPSLAKGLQKLWGE